MPQVFKVNEVEIECLHWFIAEVGWHTQRSQVIARKFNLSDWLIIVRKKLIVFVNSESSEHLRIIDKESFIDLCAISEELKVQVDACLGCMYSLTFLKPWVTSELWWDEYGRHVWLNVILKDHF